MDAAAEGPHVGPSTPASGRRRRRTTGPAGADHAPAGRAPTRRRRPRRCCCGTARRPLSVEKRFAGIGDIPLTDTGLAQARAAARRPHRPRRIDVIVTSPLKRARQTAQRSSPTALGRPGRREDDLRETDFGDWEGYTFAEVRERWPAELDAWLADPSAAPPYGESFDATSQRVAAARDKLLVRYRSRPSWSCRHVTPIKTLVRLALDAPPSALYRMHLDVACPCRVVDWYARRPRRRAIPQRHPPPCRVGRGD